MSIYYDPHSKQALEIASMHPQLTQNVSNISQQGYNDDANTEESGNSVRRVSYRSNGCSCQDLSCGCCTVFNMQQFNFKREGKFLLPFRSRRQQTEKKSVTALFASLAGCMNFTYHPLDFSISMDMFMDQHQVFTNSLSGI